MKKLFILAFTLFYSVCSFSQAPDKMSYQAVIRNGNGELVKSSQVAIKISILQQDVNGAVAFSETHSVTTNSNGLATLEIGTGTIVSGSFTLIDWANGPYYLKTETDVAGGTNYTVTGTSQLLTVPYALYAKTAENFSEIDGSVTNELQTLSIRHDTIYLSEGGFVKLPAANSLILPPEATVEGVSNIEISSAVLNGTVNANNFLTTVEFEWGTTTDYGSSITADQSPVTGMANTAITATLTSLVSDENYHYRIKAGNVINVTYSGDMIFNLDLSSLVLPTVTTGNLAEFSGTSVKGDGTITDNGGGYITAQGLCWSTITAPTIDDSLTTSFTDIISGLSANTIYYVRAYASNAAGTAYGDEVTFNSGYVPGTNALGGLVFYNDGNGNGLVCAGTDQSNGILWGCYGKVIGTTSIDFGTGAANTTAIIDSCTTASTAAKICDDLVIDVYDDWYLPSKEELDLIYKNLHLKSLGSFTGQQYWTSSEVNSATVWYQNFANGFQHYDGKEIPFRVRAVRSF